MMYACMKAVPLSQLRRQVDGVRDIPSPASISCERLEDQGDLVSFRRGTETSFHSEHA